MSETDQFWQYAREAMLSVAYAKTDEEKQDLIELARTWTQAALQGASAHQLKIVRLEAEPLVCAPAETPSAAAGLS
jgi:hypothetical protein